MPSLYVFLSPIFDSTITPLFCVLHLLAKLVESLLYLPFYESRIRSLDLQLTIVSVSWSIIILCTMFLSNLNCILVWLTASATLAMQVGLILSLSNQDKQ